MSDGNSMSANTRGMFRWVRELGWGGGTGVGWGEPPQKMFFLLKKGNKVKKHPKIMSDGNSMSANTRGMFRWVRELGWNGGTGVGWGDPLKKNVAQIRKKLKNLIVCLLKLFPQSWGRTWARLPG